MIYAIVTFKPIEGLDDKITALDANAYVDGGPTVYFLSFDGTAKQLVQKLGLDYESGPAIVALPVHTHYYGVAPGDLWNWLEVRRQHAPV